MPSMAVRCGGDLPAEKQNPAWTIPLLPSGASAAPPSTGRKAVASLGQASAPPVAPTSDSPM